MKIFNLTENKINNLKIITTKLENKLQQNLKESIEKILIRKHKKSKA